MSSYFDKAQGEIKDDFSRIEEVEKTVIRDVSLVTGDREFPDDLRKEIQGLISVWRYDSPKGREESDMLRLSWLIVELHEKFHQVAMRKIKTRFGRFSNNPDNDLFQREESLKDKA